MHIILLVILALSGLVWGIITMQREMRRRAWAKQNTTPLFAIEDPRELAAVLCFGYLKLGGDPTSEQKDALTGYFASELNYNANEATEMYRYASYVIGTDPNYADKLSDIVKPSLHQLNAPQKASILSLLKSLAATPTRAQAQFRETLGNLLA